MKPTNGVRAFLDTNVLIYLYTQDEYNKKEVAQKILNNHYCIVSTQVLNEASNVWFKKCGWNGVRIKQYLDNIEMVCDEVMLVQKYTIDKALALKDTYGYSYYDCLMIASALESGCEVLFSEDMVNEQTIDNSLTIINPFVVI